MNKEKINEVLKLTLDFLEDNYKDVILNNLQKDKRYVDIDFGELIRYSPELGDLILDDYDDVCKIFDIALKNITQTDKDFHFRLSNLPDSIFVEINKIRCKHIGKFIGVVGLVQQKTQIRPKVKMTKFECNNCGNVTYITPKEEEEKTPGRCTCKSNNWKSTAEYYDYQEIILEEPMDMVEHSGQPKQIKIAIMGDLCDPHKDIKSNPGSKVRVVGKLKDVPIKNKMKKSLIRDYVIEANNIEPIEQNFLDINITKEDEEKILRLSKNPNLVSLFVNKISPDIIGERDIKLSILLQQFGAPRVKGKGDRIGTIHILLVGDPGSGKTKLARGAMKIMPRVRYSAGRGASGVGLTATVIKDEVAGVWTLRAGPVVMSNKGVVILDEFDKMNDDDRTHLHTCMSDGIVSIQKAGIDATLIAETSILAVANPEFGTFDNYNPLASQIKLPKSLINRFDVIFPIQDFPDKDKDTKIIQSMISIRENPEEKETEEEISYEDIRKYIAYARTNIFPDKFSQSAKDLLTKEYIRIRSSGSEDEKKVKYIPINARQAETLLKLSQASARARLSNVIEEQDVKLAIDVLFSSLYKIAIDPETGRLDTQYILGQSTSFHERAISAKELILKLSEFYGKNGIPEEEIIKELVKTGLTEAKAEEILYKLKQAGEIFEPRRGFWWLL